MQLVKALAKAIEVAGEKAKTIQAKEALRIIEPVVLAAEKVVVAVEDMATRATASKLIPHIQEAALEHNKERTKHASQITSLITVKTTLEKKGTVQMTAKLENEAAVQMVAMLEKEMVQTITQMLESKAMVQTMTVLKEKFQAAAVQVVDAAMEVIEARIVKAAVAEQETRLVQASAKAEAVAGQAAVSIEVSAGVSATGVHAQVEVKGVNVSGEHFKEVLLIRREEVETVRVVETGQIQKIEGPRIPAISSAGSNYGVLFGGAAAALVVGVVGVCSTHLNNLSGNAAVVAAAVVVIGSAIYYSCCRDFHAVSLEKDAVANKCLE
jgi:hypothetical protein